ncbi:MAG: DUF1844 domain-containing protein [Phycisphaeraceae bacterium]|nr:DUF1844 domain-containing protein [Phycisphaeraceae bacterium]
MAEGDAPKIQVDSDWKAQARAEKERLSQQSKQGSEPGPVTAGSSGAKSASGRTPGQLPTPSFEALVSTMATQALFALGGIPDPRTGQRMAHLQLARHHIDLLDVLTQKTKGNLTEDESNLLAQTLYELRSRYIALSNAQRQQQQG